MAWTAWWHLACHGPEVHGRSLLLLPDLFLLDSDSRSGAGCPRPFQQANNCPVWTSLAPCKVYQGTPTVVTYSLHRSLTAPSSCTGRIRAGLRVLDLWTSVHDRPLPCPSSCTVCAGQCSGPCACSWHASGPVTGHAAAGQHAVMDPTAAHGNQCRHFCTGGQCISLADLQAQAPGTG